MKPERAQELYSDYADGTLTPALRQALDQHFAADPSAQADYLRFSRVYTLLEEPLVEVDVPLGFRAKILERVTAEQARRENTLPQRAATTFTGWFGAIPRRVTGGALAGLAAAVVAGMLLLHPSGPAPSPVAPVQGGMGGLAPAPDVDPSVIRSVNSQAEADGNTYRQFHLHLPPDVSAGTLNAYVVTANNQITDPAHLSEATPALQNQHITNRQGVQIPIAPLQAPPVGSTLNLLVRWNGDGTDNAGSNNAGSNNAGSNVVFTPFGAPDASTTAPANAGLLDAAQAVAAHYGATVIVDVSATPTQAVPADFSAPDAAAPLAVMADAVGYGVQAMPDNTFYLYRKP